MNSDQDRTWDRDMGSRGTLSFSVVGNRVQVTAIQERVDNGVALRVTRTGTVVANEVRRAHWSFKEGDCANPIDGKHCQFWINIVDGETTKKPISTGEAPEKSRIESGSIRLDIETDDDRRWLVQSLSTIIGLITVI